MSSARSSVSSCQPWLRCVAAPIIIVPAGALDGVWVGVGLGDGLGLGDGAGAGAGAGVGEGEGVGDGDEEGAGATFVGTDATLSVPASPPPQPARQTSAVLASRNIPRPFTMNPVPRKCD